MGTALVLLAIGLAVVLIPLVVSRVARRRSDDVDGYLDDQHGGDAGRQGSWPAGGGHLGGVVLRVGPTPNYPAVDRTRFGAHLHRITSRLRFWMLGVLTLVVAAFEVATGLPGLWALVVYGVGALFFALVMIAVIDREGQPMGDRDDCQHGRDIHGHYR